jgi:hypothetical protein
MSRRCTKTDRTYGERTCPYGAVLRQSGGLHQLTVQGYTNVLTKPLQGSQFVYERGCLTGWPVTEEKESKPEERAVKSGKGARTVGFLV